MKAAVYYGREDLRVEEIPDPEPGPGEMLVRVEACGICPTDLKKIQKGLLPGPRVFGHEIAGTVAELGAGVSGWTIGDRAGIGWHGGHCVLNRETIMQITLPARSLPLTVLLILIVLANLASAVLLAVNLALYGFGGTPPWLYLVSVLMNFANGISAIGIWFWKRWGIIAYGILAVGSYILSIVTTGKFTNFIGLAGFSILALLVSPYWKSMK
jgi:hypothetical protein